MSGRVVEDGLVARNSHSEEPRSLFVLCPKLASLAFISLLASLAFSSVPCLLLWSLCSSYTAMLAALALFLCVILPRSLRSRLVSLLASLALLLARSARLALLLMKFRLRFRWRIEYIKLRVSRSGAWPRQGEGN